MTPRFPRTTATIAAILFSLVVRQTQSQIFDFESTPSSQGLMSLSLTNAGLTMTITRGGIFMNTFAITDNTSTGQTGKPASWGLHSLNGSGGQRGEYEANFSAPISFFQI